MHVRPDIDLTVPLNETTRTPTEVSCNPIALIGKLTMFYTYRLQLPLFRHSWGSEQS